MSYLEWLCEYDINRVLEVEDQFPSTVLDGITLLELSILLVEIAGMTMLKNVSCKWSHNNEIATLVVYFYGGDMNCNIGDGGERCEWKVREME
jgi:hypothetical protein